ncbi:AAA family ATPase [Massilia forsythiae]|uniref:AAA family ATPase n=1 Tax=Massilia forsythiae TaxID=2728020 RepID=A0A7Z2VTE3_9BURK|nr:AAA family ATPase [Massilia forsythiae]QJD98873.1 AAA family ATPase [Massilia forsythiae]
MYTTYFNLRQAPFSIAPDPRYLFMSERHREALAHLLYGIGSGGGFVLLTGEIGAGKTTVCRCFIEQVPQDCRLAYIFNPKLTVEELLLTICDEFRIVLPTAPRAAGVKDYIDAINAHLLASHARGDNNVLVIDEAQNLSAPVLEQLRLLTNLETSERKLLQIILIGQPELRAMLARPELEQLAQRVIARYHLGPLSAPETGAYVAHRLAVAGAQSASPIPAALAPLIHRLTGGVPRRINLLCDRALLGAYVENSREVTPKILRRAAREVFADDAAPRHAAGNAAEAATAAAGRARYLAAPRWTLVAGGVLAGIAIGAAAWQALPHGASQGRRMAADGRATVAGSRAVDGTAAAAGKADNPVGAARDAKGAAVPGGGGVQATAMPAAGTFAAAAKPSAGAAASGAAAAAQGAAGAAASAAGPLALATRDAALRELGGLWGQPLPAAAPCEGAPRLGLRCYQGRGGLYELRLLDRPAIVALHDGAKVGYAVLAAMDGETATLAVGGRRQTVTLGALAARFDGEFTTLWKAPRSFRDEVGPGDSGPDVDWIAARLAQINRRDAAPAPAQPMDEPTRRLLRAFQAGQNLKADGVAGPRTYMRLNQLSGVEEPRLLAGAAAVTGKGT